LNKLAQEYADELAIYDPCAREEAPLHSKETDFVHIARKVMGHTHYGENIWAGFGIPGEVTVHAVNEWYEEKKNYKRHGESANGGPFGNMIDLSFI
jgi:hypothetical protein